MATLTNTFNNYMQFIEALNAETIPEKAIIQISHTDGKDYVFEFCRFDAQMNEIFVRTLDGVEFSYQQQSPKDGILVGTGVKTKAFVILAPSREKYDSLSVAKKAQ